MARPRSTASTAATRTSPLLGAKANMYGVGVIQSIELRCDGLLRSGSLLDIEDDGTPAADELSTIMIGSRIQF